VFVTIASKTEKDYRSFESDIPLGDQAAVTHMIFDQGFKQASIKKIKGGYLARTNEIGRWSEELTKTATKLFLMVKCAMRESTADEVMATVDKERDYSFYYQPMHKQATNIRFNQWPDFMSQVNNDYNVAQEPQTQHIMQTERDEQYMEPQRIGDRFSMETGDTVHGAPSDDDQGMDSKSPVELYQMSQQRGNSALFEHGMVGSLTNTYDSMAMVDKWLPDMEKAVDAIGRTLFLFYWKPEDFSQAYGTDDQSQLENKLVSNFKSFGSLVIEMLQKSKHNQQGTPSLA
jgi:hypothetical protein